MEGVNGFDLGYEGGWPLAAAEASSSIAASKLRSDNPLVNPPGSRFTYSYPFASPGEYKSFNQSGGHYQVICKGTSTFISGNRHRAELRGQPACYAVWQALNYAYEVLRRDLYHCIALDRRFDTGRSNSFTAKPVSFALSSVVCTVARDCRSTNDINSC